VIWRSIAGNWCSRARNFTSAGPVGRKGSIGKKEKIAVPAKNWKVIAVLDRQGLGMQGVNANTRAIAVMMPNDAASRARDGKVFEFRWQE
jgi:endonuclease G